MKVIVRKRIGFAVDVAVLLYLSCFFVLYFFSLLFRTSFVNNIIRSKKVIFD